MSVTKKVFITGASGCVGHYMINQLLEVGGYHLHLMARDPKKFKLIINHANITVHQTDMEHIDTLKDVIYDCDYIIHIATCWWGDLMINVDKALELVNMTNPDKIKKIIHFSTASIIGPDNQPTPDAETHGTGYVRSKYRANAALKAHPLKDKIISVYPTLVFGGDLTHPYSHVSNGIIPNLKYVHLLKFLSVDAKFHCTHAKDIAQVTWHALENDVPSDLIIGTPVATYKSFLKTLCQTFNIRQYFQIPLSHKLILWVATKVNKELSEWDKHCILNPFWEYKVVNSDTFGMKAAFPTFSSMLEEIKISHGH